MSGSIRIVDMPDLGTVTDASSVVGERAGSGRFGMPALRSYLETGLHYTAPGGVARSITSKLGETISVLDYGAVGDGVANDTAAIQAAMDAGAALGGARIVFPPGDYKITTSLNIGNGTGAAVSSKAGVVLAGNGAPAITGFFTGYPINSAVRIVWAGVAAPMVNVNGPLQGWGVQSIALVGNSVATIGINVVSGQFGDCCDVLITGCMSEAIGSTTVPPFGSLSNTDSLHNYWRHIAIQMPVSAGVKGIVLTGAGPSVSADTDVNTFVDVFIGLPASGTGYGIYLQNADTNQFMNVHLAGGSASATGVMFDYNGSAGNIFPSGNAFFGIETNGAVLGANSFVNSGTPSINARPNYIRGLAMDNSSTNPSAVLNLLPDLPVLFPASVWLDSRASAIPTTTLITPYEAGMYRISLYLAIQAIGNPVTVTASIAWNDGAARTATTAALNMSTGANNPLTLVMMVYSVANLALQYNTTVSGAIGAGLYRIHIVTERMS